MTELLLYGGLFLFVLGESTIIVGTFLPGLNAIVAASFLASTGRASVDFVLLAAWLGVFIGDNLGYLLGRYGLDRIPAVKKAVHKVRPDIEDFIAKHPYVIVLYDFIGFARAPLPVVLGSIQHPWRAWLRLVIIASSLFIGAVVGICYGLGRLIGEAAALKLVIGMQVLIVVIASGIVLRVVLARYKQRKS